MSVPESRRSIAKRFSSTCAMPFHSLSSQSRSRKAPGVCTANALMHDHKYDV
jgi:hypothetical protein